MSRASLRIRILDVNDNPPELATPYEAAVCEDAKPGQVAGVPQPFSQVSISACSSLVLRAALWTSASLPVLPLLPERLPVQLLSHWEPLCWCPTAKPIYRGKDSSLTVAEAGDALLGRTLRAVPVGGAAEAALLLTSTFSPQLIQTISVVDRDEPQSGHRFYFTLAPEATNNHHFSLLDIKGKPCCTLPSPAASSLSSTAGGGEGDRAVGLSSLCAGWGSGCFGHSARLLANLKWWDWSASSLDFLKEVLPAFFSAAGRSKAPLVLSG